MRSGEYQMVTLDFLALLLYFVMPLAVLLYLTWLQLPALPAALSDSIAGAWPTQQTLPFRMFY